MPLDCCRVPSMAAIRSSQTRGRAGWRSGCRRARRRAFADHSGFTYTLAPAYGLSTLVPGRVGSGSVGPPPPSTLQVTPSSVKVVGHRVGAAVASALKPKLTRTAGGERSVVALVGGGDRVAALAEVGVPAAGDLLVSGVRPLHGPLDLAAPLVGDRDRGGEAGVPLVLHLVVDGAGDGGRAGVRGHRRDSGRAGAEASSANAASNAVLVRLMMCGFLIRRGRAGDRAARCRTRSGCRRSR